MNRCVRHVTHNTCVVVPTLSGFPQHIIDRNQLLYKIDVLIFALIRCCKYWYGFHFKSFGTEIFSYSWGGFQMPAVHIYPFTFRCKLVHHEICKMSPSLSPDLWHDIHIPATVLSLTAILCNWHAFCQHEDIQIDPHSSRTFSVHPKVFKHAFLYKLLT